MPIDRSNKSPEELEREADIAREEDESSEMDAAGFDRENDPDTIDPDLDDPSVEEDEEM